MRTIFIGSDHRGFEKKEILKKLLLEKGYTVNDCGAYEYQEGDDYPDYAERVADKVVENEGSFGVLLCGSGVGMCLAANKIKNVRCVVGHSLDEVKSARQEDNCNVIAFSADNQDLDQMSEMIDAFGETAFLMEERFQRRIIKMERST
ncbi:MAG: ribose 5-phosphate isomerase [Patescibacteria group bacterium]|nr:ribose 5-phosphate isomerase [Patescibacteria group bacterium]